MPKTKNIWDVFYINDEFFIYPIIDKIKNKEEYKRLFSNFISLSVLQAANYLLPLITLPYLVRVLGPEKYGLVSFAQAFVTYFMILTDYGFNLSATREISINRDNKKKVSEIFSSVMTIKAGLLIVSFMLMSIIVFSFGKFSRDWPIYYLTFGMVLGQFLFPVWFFQGMERMKYITVLNITAKLIFTVAIFVFVHHMEDFLYVPLLNTLGYIIAGILSLWLIFRDFNISFNPPSLSDIKHHLKEGWDIFLTTIAVSLYTTSNTFILGLFTNNTIVGYYTGAEKIVKAVQGLLAPISQTIYPYISKLVSESKERAIKFIKKLVIIIGTGSFILSLFILIFASPIVNIILGNQYHQSIIVLQILSFLPFIIGLSDILGIQTMLAFNMKSEFLKVIGRLSIVSVILFLILTPLFKQIGTAISWFLTETFITIYMFIILNRNGINILKGKLEYEEK
jgi:PST family polysaccharide transporter